MIIFEDRLAELVGTLPMSKDANNNEYQISFNWGTEEVLAKYLLLNGKLSFPLIWLVEGVDMNNEREPSVTRNARIVILRESEAPNQFNDYQHEFDYKVILQPILDNLLTALKQSGFSSYDKESFNTQRVKNYSMRNAYEINTNNKEKTNNSLIFVCNAIVLDAKITFNSNCLQNINY